MANGGRQLDKDAPFFRRREGKREERAKEKDQDWFFTQAKDRLSAANEAIRTTRTFFFALLSIAAYIGVIIASTTDEQLLRIAPVKLPIIGVEVPLTGFYIFVPWLFVLLHFNLLIHLGLTSRKLKRFLDDLKPLDTELSNRLRNDVANFPLAQWMVGNNDAVFRVVLSILVWIMLVLIPPFLLLWMQLRFLAFQAIASTWLQGAAVTVDALLIVGFRTWFVWKIQPETQWRIGWVKLAKYLDKNSVGGALLFRYLMPMIPLGLALHLAVGMSYLQTVEEVPDCKWQLSPTNFFGSWLCKQYRLDLREKLLTRGTPSPAIVNALRGVSFLSTGAAESDSSSDVAKQEEQALIERRNKALEEVLGLDLQGRSFRGANLEKAVLPRADFRRVQLQGANLWEAQLQGANLRKAQLQGANLWEAQLQGANLWEAQLQGANLFWANLQGANLWEAQLQGANLRKAQLQGAKLWKAQLQGAELWEAQLEGAKLWEAQLQGAILWEAQLQGAELGEAQLEGAKLWEAQLQGANLFGANLQGADLSKANLEWADLTKADLSFAYMKDIQNLDTAELAGADFVFADGLEGTFLDINQPPPDLLPAL